MTSMDSINDTWFDEANGIVAGVVSFVFNAALIIATSQVKIYSHSVKRMQIFGCVLRLLFSVSVILSSPTLAYITEAEAVYIVKGGFQLPIHFGEAVLITFVTFVIFSCMGPPMQFLQVVFILKKSKRSQKEVVFLTSAASFVVSFTGTVLLALGYTPDVSDDKLSTEIVYNLNGKGTTAYLIASLERYDYSLGDWVPDPVSWACTLYILAVLVISTVISVICWLIIKRQIQHGAMSANSVKAQQQLNTVLIVQFTLPFLTIHIPFYVSFLMPLFRVETSHLSIYLPYLFSWCPALGPIVVLIMVESIREKVFAKKVSGSSRLHSSGNIVIKPKNLG
ncbi:unnamed protein product [Caenorhabditis sp. 36 PRJEB53466]|nr:unnamed protein product [Caenorhabditis sp. 36 PRJEB53466]